MAVKFARLIRTVVFFFVLIQVVLESCTSLPQVQGQGAPCGVHNRGFAELDKSLASLLLPSFLLTPAGASRNENYQPGGGGLKLATTRPIDTISWCSC